MALDLAPALLAGVFIVIVVAASWLFWGHGPKYDARLVAFFTVISSLALGTAFLTVVFQQAQAVRQEQQHATETVINQESQGYLDLQQLLSQGLPDTFVLVQQLNQNNRTLQRLAPPPVDNASTAYAKQALACHAILERVETVFLSLGGPSADWTLPNRNAQWLRTWRSWFRSPLLRQIWADTKFRYTFDTQNFVDTTILKKGT